jgi:hypothetical protein
MFFSPQHSSRSKVNFMEARGILPEQNNYFPLSVSVVSPNSASHQRINERSSMTKLEKRRMIMEKYNLHKKETSDGRNLGNNHYSTVQT